VIRELVLLGSAAYLIIALVQWLQNQTVNIQAVALAGLLIVLAFAHGVMNGKRLKQVEMAALWFAIALFVVYAVLMMGGFV
jgi:hypothetical protein